MSVEHIGKYEVQEAIGKGSMGVVYAATDPEIGRKVAIKTLRSMYMGDDPAGEEALKRFQQESRSAGMLRHPNIVMIFEAGKTEDGSPYIVMEYIEGKSLEGVIKETEGIDPLEGIHYLAQIASAIDYAHTHSIIHRDIKPSNILIDDHGNPRLLDFGVAKLSDTSLTPAGTVVGTPSYMAPEQIRGEKLDGSTDIFALAVVTFEALVGTRPFPGKDFTTVVGNIIHKEPLTFESLDCDLPAELEKVLARGLSKDRKERPETALDFISQLADVFKLEVDSRGVRGFRPGMLLSTFDVGPIANTEASSSESALANGSAPAEEDSASTQKSEALSEYFAEEESQKGSVQISGPGNRDQTQPILPAIDEAMVDISKLKSTPDDVSVSSTDTAEIFSKDIRNMAASSGAGPVIETKEGQSQVLKFTLFVGCLFAVSYLYFGSDFERQVGNYLNETTSGLTSSDEGNSTVDGIEDGADSTSEIKVAKNVKAVKPSLELVEPISPLSGWTKSNIKDLNNGELGFLLGKEGQSVDELTIFLTEAGSRNEPLLTPHIVKLFDHDHVVVRTHIVKAVSSGESVSEKESVELIVKALGDKEYLVRGFAAKGASNFSDPKVLSALKARAKKEDNSRVVKLINKSISKMSKSG